MIYGLYAMRDLKSTYMSVLTDVNDSCAIRGFRQACIVPDSILANNPTDYALYKLGTYDIESGRIESIVPELLCDAAQFIRKEVVDEVCNAV